MTVERFLGQKLQDRDRRIEELEAELSEVRQQLQDSVLISSRVIIQRCAKCGEDYPQFSVSSSMTCPKCKCSERIQQLEQALKKCERLMWSMGGVADETKPMGDAYKTVRDVLAESNKTVKP